MDIQNAIQSCNYKGKPHMIFGFFVILFLVSVTIWFGVGIWSKISSGVDQNPAMITVSGDGEIYAKPDLATVDLSVVTDKKTVAEAMTENTTQMNAVIGAIKSQGVDAKDIKTTDFSIYPKYEWQNAICPTPSPLPLSTSAEKVSSSISYCPPGKSTLTGYEVTQQLEVKVRALDKVGDVIQSATAAGANQVGDFQFTIENPDTFTAQAREQAIVKAKAKAKELASQLGVRLVKITSFSENGNYPYPVYMTSAKASGLGGGMADSVAAPQIQTGQNKITASVSITYEIK